MAKRKKQPAASKYIKRINEQMKNVFEFSHATGLQEPLLPWSKAVRESGLVYKRSDKGHLVIANTAANRAIISNLKKSVKEHGAKSLTDYKKSIKRELEKEKKKSAPKAKKTSRKSGKKSPPKVTKEEIEKRMQQKVKSQTLEEMLDVLYKKGYYTETRRGSMNFYDFVDKIEKLYNEVISAPNEYENYDFENGDYPF